MSTKSTQKHDERIVPKTEGNETKNRGEINAIMNLVHIKGDLKNARIKSAIEKGTQTLLTAESRGLHLSKFEHRGKDGNLVVYTQDGSQQPDKPVNYKVITTYRPPDSLRNQLFFAADPSSRSTRSQSSKQITVNHAAANTRTRAKPQSRRRKARIPAQSLSKLPKLDHSDKESQEKLDSFEQILTKYKSKRERERRILGLGDEHTKFAQKLDNLYIERKRERNTMRTTFSVSEKIHLEHEKDAKQEVEITQEKKKLPRIKFQVDEVKDRRDRYGRTMSLGPLAKQDSRMLKVPPKRRPKRTLPKLSRKDLLADLEFYNSQSSNRYESSMIQLPKL